MGYIAFFVVELSKVYEIHQKLLFA